MLPAAEGLTGGLGSALHGGQGGTDGSGAPGSCFISLTNLSAAHLSPQNTDSVGGQDCVRPRLRWREVCGTKGRSGSHYTVPALFKSLCDEKNKKLSRDAAHPNSPQGLCVQQCVLYPPGTQPCICFLPMDSLS